MQREEGILFPARNDMYTRAMLKATSRGLNTVPNQAIPNRRKGKKFYKDTLEAYEKIGLKQVQENLKFNDLYAMLDGELIVTDFISNSHLLDKIGSLYKKADFDIPDYVKPFDLLSRVVRYQSTKYSELQHRFNVDFLDPISENEIDREFNNRLIQYSKEMFEIELQMRQIELGLTDEGQYESEEEQQKALAELEARKALVSSPEDIKNSIQKEWKPLAADWVKNTIERDKRRSNYVKLYQNYYRDFYTTGRYFNHINIHKMGVYTQERWSPIYTFFSQDYEIEFPQYASYVGYVDTIGKDQLVTEHGQSIKNSDLKKLINYDGGKSSTETDLTDPNTYRDILEGDVVEGLPSDYYQREAYSALEDHLGLPTSKEYYFNMDGEAEERPSFMKTYGNTTGGLNSLLRKHTRRDIDVQDDIYLRTRVYWTSYEKVGYIYFEDDGVIRRSFVTEDILPEVLERHDIQVKRSVTIRELDEMEREGKLESGIICYTTVPKTYYGVLIRTKNLGLDDDLVIEEGRMELQIRGDDDNIYQVLKPVTGIITTAEIDRLLPYQIEYTYNLNLARKYSENELGMLFLFDINFLNSEYSSHGDSGEEFLNFVRDVRENLVIPVDGSRRNLREGQGMQMNPMGTYEVTNTNIINEKRQAAEYYKALLLEEAGLSQQLLHEPQKYVTAAGVKTSDTATQTILDYNFNRMDEAYIKDLEVVIRIAQYFEGEKDEVTLSHTRSDGELELMRFKDKFIAMRKFNLISLEDSNKRRTREEIKNYILSNNTFEDDTETLIKIATSDSYTSLMSEVKKKEAKTQELREQEQAREQQAAQEQNESIVQAEKVISEREAERNRIEIKKAIINALARYRNVDGSSSSDSKQIKELYDNAFKEKQLESKENIEMAKIETNAAREMSEAEYRAQRLEIEKRKLERDEKRLDIREKERQSNNFRKTIDRP